MTRPYSWTSNRPPGDEQKHLIIQIEKKEARLVDAKELVANLTKDIATKKNELEIVQAWISDRSDGARAVAKPAVDDNETGEFARFELIIGLTWASRQATGKISWFARATDPKHVSKLRESCATRTDEELIEQVADLTRVPFNSIESNADNAAIVLDVAGGLAQVRHILREGRKKGGEHLALAEANVRRRLSNPPTFDKESRWVRPHAAR